MNKLIIIGLLLLILISFIGCTDRDINDKDIYNFCKDKYGDKLESYSLRNECFFVDDNILKSKEYVLIKGHWLERE